MSISRRADGGSLQDYISGIRKQKPIYDRTASGPIRKAQSLPAQSEAKVAAQAEAPAAAPETRVATEAGPASQAAAKSAALDYTKGGVAVVQGMYEAAERQKQLQADMAAEKAAGTAGASIKRAKMQGEGMQSPLRQIMAAYRPR